MKRMLGFAVVGALVVASLLFVSADPALARTNFSFGLNIGFPVAPYPAYVYPYPPPAYYPPVPYYRPLYPPCARVWTPGYYDPYGNWVFGYYRYDCGYYR